MSQPMLNISKQPSNPQTIPHLLPCRVHYDGPVEPIQSYWSPSEAKDGTKVAYFRGRKLHGKAVRLPEGYRGVVVQKGEVETTTTPAATAPEPEADELGDEPEVGTGRLEARAGFEEVVVWGHETTADAGSDPVVRGLEEWLALAEKIHSYPAGQGS
ncbi:ribonuclease H2, subunit C [Phialemonium atrogriseum]|uniref:Ribonuclease H2, subunit C n=1 Tax=Phialemonium atrogriseum TaxID=1093897 RepID=A0AAJ0BZW4_9PEZI|nr:ribonuclease H2, subunit C [Phialemonium atrogriseum]KAK1766892.1 ribonuclease H2, subunit C [Phialemonium atrogriseum]